MRRLLPVHRELPSFCFSIKRSFFLGIRNKAIPASENLDFFVTSEKKEGWEGDKPFRAYCCGVRVQFAVDEIWPPVSPHSDLFGSFCLADQTKYLFWGKSLLQLERS